MGSEQSCPKENARGTVSSPLGMFTMTNCPAINVHGVDASILASILCILWAIMVFFVMVALCI